MARAARDALRLDLVLFAPVGSQPLKPQGSTAPFEDRAAMTELAIAAEPAFELSRIDAPNAAGLPNFTLQTLEQLHAGMPDAELFCLMGADSFVSLRRWRGAAQIPFAASLVVASRPGENLGDLAASLPAGISLQPARAGMQSADPHIELRACTLRNTSGQTAAFYMLPGLDVEISATDIRAQIRTGDRSNSPEQLVPDPVARYIREHGLYQ